MQVAVLSVRAQGRGGWGAAVACNCFGCECARLVLAQVCGGYALMRVAVVGTQTQGAGGFVGGVLGYVPLCVQPCVGCYGCDRVWLVLNGTGLQRLCTNTGCWGVSVHAVKGRGGWWWGAQARLLRVATVQVVYGSQCSQHWCHQWESADHLVRYALICRGES